MRFLGLTADNWLNLSISGVVILVTIVAGRWLINLLIERVLRRFTGRTSTRLDDLLVEGLKQPAYWFLVVLVAEAMVARLSFLPNSWDDPLADIFFILYFIVVFVLVWRLSAALFDWYALEMTARAEEPKLAEGLTRFFQRIVLIVVAIIGLIVLLSHFGANITGLVTTLGVGSLAIALAAQAAFEDTISSFVIMLDKPFRVGDRVEILDLDTWGDVIDIGLRSSRIRTVDNRMVVVPNSVIGKSLIVNYSYPNNEYRIETSVGVAYGTDIEAAREAIYNAVRATEGVLPDRPVEVLFDEFGDSALNFRVLWWIELYSGKRLVDDRVNSAIYKALNAAGIEMPFPQRDLNVKLHDEDIRRLVSAWRGSLPPGEGPSSE